MASTRESTVEEQADFDQHLRRLRLRRWVRRAVLAVLGLVVVLGIVGLLGERTGRVHAAAAGVSLTVSYPSIVRDGPPTSLEITVVRAGGFSGAVDLAFDGRYLSALDQVSVSPQPDSERAAGDDVVWTFSQPAGDRLVVDIDAQVSSQARFRHPGQVRLVDGGDTVVAVRFTTRVWP
jgi:hypothetical protein